VQIGRHSHPLDFISSSPIFYLHPLDVLGVSEHDAFPLSTGKPSRAPTNLQETVIGNDVYIGHGAFILPGVKIGHGSVIGACSVVTKDVPPYAVVAGSPAKIKKHRFDSGTIDELLKSEWWEYSPNDFAGLDPAKPHDFINRVRELRRIESPQYKPNKLHLDNLQSINSPI